MTRRQYCTMWSVPFFVLIAWVGSGAVSHAHAQTPDGETPAQKSVCDELKDGYTKGLYGLCIAFCEAQDWETDCLEDPAACGRSGDRLLRNYNKKMQEGDPPMPCLVSDSECPCWNGTQPEGWPEGSTLADLWLTNTPADCGTLDRCLDKFDDDEDGDIEFQSTAACVQDVGNNFFTGARKFGEFGNCTVFGTTAEGRFDLSMQLDLPTAELCLLEHDAFTVGGTFPFYRNDACGLPMPQ